MKILQRSIKIKSFIFCIAIIFLPTIYFQNVQAIGNSKTGKTRSLYISIEEDYGSLKPTSTLVSKWMREDLEKVFLFLNFSASRKKELSDITIDIKLSGVPIQASYQKVGNLYAGADVSGEVRLSNSEKIKLISFSGKASPPSPILTFKDDLKKPEQAPFHKAYQNSNFMIVLSQEIEILLGIPKEQFLTSAMLMSSAREKVGDDLANIGIGAAPYLAEVLNDKRANFEARIKAAEALGNTGLDDAAVLDPLRIAMDDKANHLRYTAAIAIAQISRKMGRVGDTYSGKAVSVLTHYLAQGDDPYYRQESIKALGDLRNGQAVEPLLKAINKSHDNVYIKQLISEALAKINE